MIVEPTTRPAILAGDARYAVRFAETPAEVRSALRLRFQVFTVEMQGGRESDRGLEFDDYDARCRHLIVVERATGQTVGTYRLNSIETARKTEGFYSNSEFTLEDLPPRILTHGVEIGRACIAAKHRNSNVLFLLWKALAAHLVAGGKRYFFGCCSIFTRSGFVGERAFKQLARGGHLDPTLRVEPRRNALYLSNLNEVETEDVELPALFEMYLRIGAKVCGRPTVDEEFVTVDFFVVLDFENLSPRYRKLFFS